MSFVFTFLITSVSAVLAWIFNPLVRLSPVSVYGMQERQGWADLVAVVVSVIFVKVLLNRLLGSPGDSDDLPPLKLIRSLLCSLVSISVVAIALFLVTTLPCSPNFLILFCLSEIALLTVGAWAGAVRSEEPLFVMTRVWPIPRRLMALMMFAFGLPAEMVIVVWSYKRFPDFKRRVNIAQNHFRTRGDYVLEPVFGELRFRQPIDFEVDFETGDCYVLERGGRLFRIDQQSENNELLVDFRADVGPPPDAELGAYSLKLHPDFQRNLKERLYLFYTSRTEKGHANKLLELDLLAGGAGEIWEQRRIVLQFPCSATSHNSGALDFDEDGFLFVGLGDVERKGDAQVLGGPLNGKILRIDPGKRGGSVSFKPELECDGGTIRDYFVPAGNPFVGREGIHGEIWAYGLRNPFRIHWESSLKALLVGDVGQLKWEELNLVRAGDNCGWPAFEGKEVHDPEELRQLGETEIRDPVFVYRHDALNRSVVGGFFHQGTGLPGLGGSMVAGDNFSGNIWAVRANGRGGRELLAKAPDYNQSGISKISEGPSGEIRVCVMGSIERDSGTIYRLTSSSESTEPVETAKNRPVAEVFSTQCALCHGPSGDGLSAMAREFPVVMPDFSSKAWQDSVSDDELIKAIALGGAAVGKTGAMPAWGSLLSESEIDQMVTYLRSLPRGIPLRRHPEGAPE